MKMQRQAMIVSPDGLRKLADKLEKESKEESKRLGLEYKSDKMFQVNIINESDCSDTWKFED